MRNTYLMWMLYEFFSLEYFERIRNLESYLKFSISNFNANSYFSEDWLKSKLKSKELNVILPAFRKLTWNSVTSVSGNLGCYQCVSSHWIFSFRLKFIYNKSEQKYSKLNLTVVCCKFSSKLFSHQKTNRNITVYCAGAQAHDMLLQ